MPREKKNNISIFLIREEITEPTDIIENIDLLNKKDFLDEGGALIGTLYFPESFNRPPSWLDKFFGIREMDVKFLNSNTRAIFLSKGAGRIFALTFGYGKNLLKKEIYEDNFGLLTTLNLVLPDTLKCIEKTDLSMSGKKSKEQLSSSGNIGNFGVDIEQNLINEITGESKDKEFGKIVTGKESFHIKVPVTSEGICGFLPKCLDVYKKIDYKDNFGWIDNIKNVIGKKIIKNLDSLLIEKIKSEASEKIWLAVPEVIAWSDTEGFKYGKTAARGEAIYEDLYLPNFREFLEENILNINIDDLKHKYNVFCGYDFESNEYKKWNIYECLYCEVDYENEYYVFSNAKWYKVNDDFIKDINERFKSIPEIKLGLPDYEEGKYSGKGDNKGEQGYNKDVADNNSDFILFDRENIYIGGGRNKIEFCDLFSKSKKHIIHVKKYGGSSVFSHLFNQGLVSGELMLSEKKF